MERALRHGIGWPVGEPDVGVGQRGAKLKVLAGNNNTRHAVFLRLARLALLNAAEIGIRQINGDKAKKNGQSDDEKVTSSHDFPPLLKPPGGNSRGLIPETAGFSGLCPILID